MTVDSGNTSPCFAAVEGAIAGAEPSAIGRHPALADAGVNLEELATVEVVAALEQAAKRPGLDHASKTELYRRHISLSLITSWKAGRRLPTEVQVADLADVTHTDWVELQKEVTVLRAPEDRREAIAKAINWRNRSLSSLRRALQIASRLANRRHAAIPS